MLHQVAEFTIRVVCALFWINVTVAVALQQPDNQGEPDQEMQEPHVEEPETESDEADSDDTFDESESVMEAFEYVHNLTQV